MFYWEIIVNVIETTFLSVLLYKQLAISANRILAVVLCTATLIFVMSFLNYLDVNLNIEIFGGVVIYFNRIVLFGYLLVFTNVVSNKSFSENLIWSCVPPLIVAFSDFLVIKILEFFTNYSLNEMINYGETRTITTTLYLIITCSIYSVLIILNQKKAKYSMLIPMHLRILLIIILLLGTIAIDQIIDLYSYTYSSASNGSKANFIAISFFVILLSVIILTQQMGKITNTLMIAQKETIANENYKELERSYNTLKKVKHDMNNHFLTMQGLVSKKQLPELEKYFIELRGEYYNNDTVFTGNTALNVIIAAKISKARSHSIKVNYKILGLECIKDKHSEITSILGNLLDNAIEASCLADDPDERLVNLSVIVKGNMLLIEIKNNTDGDYRIKDGELLTRKDGLFHGTGLSIVSNTVKKYGGYLELEPQKDAFLARVCMPIDRLNEKA